MLATAATLGKRSFFRPEAFSRPESRSYLRPATSGQARHGIRDEALDVGGRQLSAGSSTSSKVEAADGTAVVRRIKVDDFLAEISIRFQTAQLHIIHNPGSGSTSAVIENHASNVIGDVQSPSRLRILPG